MNRQEITSLIASKTGQSTEQVTSFLGAAREVVEEQVTDGNSVIFSDFGTLEKGPSAEGSEVPTYNLKLYKKEQASQESEHAPA